ncbi:MAG: DUF1043 family protein [Pseudomonadales bacterium]|nr:DUF1043 family protein [Pseudomonadales bacterium]
MFSLVTVIITGFICTATGAAAGLFLGSRLSATPQKTRELEKHLHEKQDEIKAYQREVTEHFTETSQRLQQLAESYKDIHNHLAQGADKLSGQGSGHNAPIIERIENNTVATANDTPDTVSAPLDYAPKTTPFDKGTLNEDYNLEKVELNENPVADIADIADIIAENAQKN